MAIFKCKMCGGNIEFEPGATVGVCDSCGTKQTLPRLDDDRRANLYDRANHFRRNNEFDKAAGIYEQILNEDTTDAEAYWSLVLCQYGIEYVDDPATHKRIPTVNRAQFTSVFDDVNYKSAIQYADPARRELYEIEAKTINDIQKGILAISEKEDPFDVFICYKETDQNGRRTMDSVLANELYYQLKQEGFKVFFSRITLEDKLGTAYEPYIFAALNSAKVMVVLGTRPEHFNAVWVKNEWSRYLALVKKSGGKKVLIPAYRDMDPYDLPEEFSHLQAQDMSKLGFMQDLIRGIKKLAKAEAPKTTVKETVVIGGNANVAPLLKRAFIFLEDGNWQEADEYCERVLDQDPENAEAYLGKLMAEMKVRQQKELENCEQPFDSSNNYQKAIRFGGEKMSSVLSGFITKINERNENARLIGLYNAAVSAMNSANNEATFKTAAEKFKAISGFKDADSLIKQCLEKAEVCRKDAIYSSAKARMTHKTTSEYEAAINEFCSISGWKDSDEQIGICQKKIEEIKAKEEADRLEAARKVEERRIASEKASKKRKKVIAIIMPIVVASITFLIVLTTVFIPSSKYNSAMELYNAQKYEDAYKAFNPLSYKDSAEKASECLFLKQKASLTNVSVGSTIKYGFYEQDNNTSNGKEEIEWKVLAVEGNKALIISRYALDCKPYNDTYTDTTWEKCTLRTWLNGAFYDAAFGADHQRMITSSTVTADENPSYSTSPGNNTTDKVFLLSITEVNKYFSSNSVRQRSATAYAKVQGAETNAGNGNCWWWLRSPGNNSCDAACVGSDGGVREGGRSVNLAINAVRPALWINLE